MYISIADEPNATAYFDKLISRFGQSAGIAAAVENVAQEYLELRNTQKAYEKFHYILEHWPESDRAIWAKTGMAMSRIRGLDLEAGESELLELLDKYSQDKKLPDAVHEIVEEYRNVGAYTEGREIFEYLLKNPFEGPGTMLELQVGIALQSIKLGELDKAEAAVEKLIADYNDNPNLAKGLFQIGEEYWYVKNCSEAIKLWELILNEYPDSEFENKSETPYVLAVCYESLGNPDKAIEYYEMMLDNSPAHRFAERIPYKLGVLYRGKGEFAEAVHWFGQQRQLYSSELYARRSLLQQAAVYYYDLKDYEKATEAYGRYKDKYPDDKRASVAYLLLARSHEKMGDLDEAIKILAEASEKFAASDGGGEIAEELARMREGGEK